MINFGPQPLDHNSKLVVHVGYCRRKLANANCRDLSTTGAESALHESQMRLLTLKVVACWAGGMMRLAFAIDGQRLHVATHDTLLTSK